jgi:hypothetical protein
MPQFWCPLSGGQADNFWAMFIWLGFASILQSSLTSREKTDSCSLVHTVGSNGRHLAGQARSRAPQLSMQLQKATFKKSALVLTAILFGFLLLQTLLPLTTTIKIGADEGFELAKATLCISGYHLYTDIWNDQPPLDTFLVTHILKDVSASVLAPRLMTIAFSLLLLISVFVMAHRVHGLAVAAFATIWVVASPGFLELSCSVMQEIPALAPALAALAVLLVGPANKKYISEIIAGLLMAVALQMKFIELVYLPVTGLILFLRCRNTGSQISPKSPDTKDQSRWLRTMMGSKEFIVPSLVFTASLAASFALLAVSLEGNYWLQFQQTWASHFAAPVSLEYGSPAEHAFDWRVLLKNWDTTVPAFVGIILCVRQWKRVPLGLVPAALLVLTLWVVGRHKPWWTYYYIHNAIPLCWCGAVGFIGAYRFVFGSRRVALKVMLGTFAISAAIWMGARLYLQVMTIRNSAQIYSSLVLQEIERLKPFAQFIYTDEPVYSFHSGIPLPPELGVVSLKRFWSGDLSNDRLVDILAKRKPGLVLWRNESRGLPFDALLQADYRLVYDDSRQRLYARTEVLEKARQ